MSHSKKGIIKIQLKIKRTFQNMTNKRSLKAFSLIEISIVILIIGILIVGVTQSSRLVSQAKINSAKALTQSSPASSIPGLSFWIETSNPQESLSDENIEDGESIAVWNDINPQSSIRSNLEGTAPTYSTDGINSIPALVFDADELSSGNFSDISSGKITLFAVVKLPSTLAEQTIVSKSDGTNVNFAFNTLASAAGWTFCDGGTCYPATSSGVSINGAYVISVVYNADTLAVASSTEAGVTIFQNGIPVLAPAGTDGNSPDITGSAVELTVGNTDGGSANFAGTIGEILIYDRSLKQEERQSVENYLGKKWGIRITASTY